MFLWGIWGICRQLSEWGFFSPPVYPNAGSAAGLHDLKAQRLVWTNTLSLVHDSRMVFFSFRLCELHPFPPPSPVSVTTVGHSGSEMQTVCFCRNFFFFVFFCLNSSAGRFLTCFPLFDHAVAVQKTPRRLLCVGRDRSHQEANQVTSIVPFISHCWQRLDREKTTQVLCLFILLTHFCQTN